MADTQDDAFAERTLRAILYNPKPPSPAGSQEKPGPSLQILDQLALPHQTIYLSITNAQDGFNAIRSMSVRGAPAIAIVAALSVAVQIASAASKAAAGESAAVVRDEVLSGLKYLLGSRPTAVNLKDAVVKLTKVTNEAAEMKGADAHGVRKAYIAAAETMLIDDVFDNESIGHHGAKWIEKHLVKGEKVSVLTHCNTGSLATAGYGTALGIVRALNAFDHLAQAYYTETRPYNQGSRLTGYELIHDKIPCTLITDSMAAALFQKSQSEGNGIAAVIVGADRVAANGDTANKIGTYSLAVLARYHGVKFLVAAPRTTIDLATPSGNEIVIEQRPPEEMLTVKGPRSLGFSSESGLQSVETKDITAISIAALGTKCWNPAFDITPAELIDGIVTELGVVEKDGQGRFDLQALFSKTENKDQLQHKDDMPDPTEGP